MLTAWLATLHKDRFIERQPGTIVLPQGLGLLIRSFWFGSNLPTGQEGGRASMVPTLRGLVCVILCPLEVGPIVGLPESLAVTPYQRGPL